jgi:hypothetical protein
MHVCVCNAQDINPLKPRVNCMCHLLYQLVMLGFCIYGSCMILSITGIIFLNSMNQLLFVMVKCDVIFVV